MNRNYLFGIGLFLMTLCTNLTTYAQDDNNVSYESVSLSGPRLGMTIIGGEMANKLKEDYDAVPFITQFGWQFEWRFFSVADGPTGVVECVPLIGGVEQGLFLPSLTVPIGMRLQNGIEFGVGPNVSVAGFAIVIAAGVSLLPSKKGTRLSFLIGFNVRRH
jgi:hypothetical protein